MMCWQPNHSKGFQVKPFFFILTPRGPGCFLWTTVWKAKLSSRTDVLGKILTVNNVQQRDMVVVSWY